MILHRAHISLMNAFRRALPAKERNKVFWGRVCVLCGPLIKRLHVRCNRLSGAIVQGVVNSGLRFV